MLSEFDSPTYALLQSFGDNGRLVVVEDCAVITYWELIQAWSWLRAWADGASRDLLTLHELIAVARNWSEEPGSEKSRFLVRGDQRDRFGQLAKDRTFWLSSTDWHFIETSRERRTVPMVFLSHSGADTAPRES